MIAPGARSFATMNFKIAFSDIDGTLLNAAREPSAALVEQVGRLRARGVPFVLISSRPPRAMVWIQDLLGVGDQPLVAYNGGLVLVDGRVVHTEEIPLTIVRTTLELARGTGLSVQLFHADEWYVADMDHYATREAHNTRVTPTVRSLAAVAEDWRARGVGAHKIMVMGPAAELDELSAALGRDFGERLHRYRSKDDYLEVASGSVSKLTGVRQVLAARYPELGPEDCLAFGDNYNDVAMLAGVGTGVAVANARPEAKAVADYVSPHTAKEDAVARYLTGGPE